MFIKEINEGDEDNGTYLRSCIVLAFFINKSIQACSEDLLQVLDKYIQSIPPDTLKWCVPSASAEEWHETKKATISRIKSSLAPEKSSKRDMTAFNLADSTSAALYSFRLVGESNEPDESVWVQMSFPGSIITDNGVEEFVVGVNKLAELAQATYGYCSPGFNYKNCNGKAYNKMKGYAMRHPGYDAHVNEYTRWDIGIRTRGARWITFLGEELTKKLGGINKLKEQLTEPITVEEMNNSVMIRAGKFPEIGDVNRKIDTPLLRKVAKVLEPVTFFNDEEFCTEIMDFDKDLARKWERRFLD
jgi:hypothetical protein